jgi:hypothetical protein
MSDDFKAVVAEIQAPDGVGDRPGGGLATGEVMLKPTGQLAAKWRMYTLTNADAAVQITAVRPMVGIVSSISHNMFLRGMAIRCAAARVSASIGELINSRAEKLNRSDQVGLPPRGTLKDASSPSHRGGAIVHTNHACTPIIGSLC